MVHIVLHVGHRVGDRTPVERVRAPAPDVLPHLAEHPPRRILLPRWPSSIPWAIRVIVSSGSIMSLLRRRATVGKVLAVLRHDAQAADDGQFLACELSREQWHRLANRSLGLW